MPSQWAFDPAISVNLVAQPNFDSVSSIIVPRIRLTNLCTVYSHAP